jgi:hypothetical protein
VDVRRNADRRDWFETARWQAWRIHQVA